MSVVKAKEFLVSLKEKAPDDRFVEKLKSVRHEDEYMSLFAEIAASTGYDLSRADIEKALSELDAERKAKTKAANREMEALPDDDLRKVAGGFTHYSPCSYNKSTRKEGCIGDFTDDDCWWDNACDSLYYLYYDCEDKYHKD